VTASDAGSVSRDRREITGAPDGVADAIIVAAGAGRRMGTDKGMLYLLGRPLLAWTVDALATARSVRRIVLVTAEDRVASLSGEPWVRDRDAVVVPGGRRRQESVAIGVDCCDAEIVLVHDGARPLVTPGLVDAVAAASLRWGAAIPCLTVAETIKRVEDGRVVATVDRTNLALAQTPQGARRDLLLAAYARHDPRGERTFTDEAALLEAAGFDVAAVPGEPENLKVTVPADLGTAAALLAARGGPLRVGHGADSHPFGPGTGLALGGIVIEGAPRLHGHSDGDVILHAVADAVLGAAGLGDLGRLFPAGDPTTRGIASAYLLATVVERAAAIGLRPDGVDIVVVAARPRLGPARLEAMRAAVARLLSLPVERVGMKASSGNLSGDEGAGRGISATAIATVRPG
jgi:2-C-methyl-D-erythritol 4-phosphate cytidylyltransferase / 2-C-methyl-D-erythritol 2,4-cyclodiphosphate synthase